MHSFFANPWMLSAAAAVALPLLIEWLFRRRKKQVPLPTIRFLLLNREQEKIKRQDRILLLLRMLGVFLLVLAVSRPLVRHGMLGAAPQRHIAILLDGTSSMNQQVGVTTAFGLAQKKAAAMVRELPEEALVSVAILGGRVDSLVEQEKDRHTAAARLAAVRTAAGAGTIEEGLSWMKDYLEKCQAGKPEVYIFSDFQKRTWMGAAPSPQPSPPGGEGRERGAARALRDLSARYEVFLVDVGGQPTFNYVLAALRPEEWLVSTGMPVRFLVQVEVWGKPPENAKATVSFLVDGEKKAVRDARPSDKPASLVFEHRFAKAGEYVVEAVLEGDEHRVDNRRLYLCTVCESAQVLVLDDGAGAVEQAVSLPTPPQAGQPVPQGGGDLGRESAYLVRALAPPTHPAMEQVSRFSTKTIHPAQLSYENLDRYVAVALTDTGSLNEGIAAKLENYVSDGGSLWVFAGPRANPYQYNKLLYKDGKGLLPAQLKAPVVVARLSPVVNTGETPVLPTGGKDQDRVSVRYGGSDHPALAQLTGSGNPDAQVAQYADLEPGAGARVVAPLSNGAPALIERSFGRGKVLLSSFSAGVSWTYLPATVEFPILVQELMRYLVGNPDAAVNLSVGDRFEEPVYVSSQHLVLRTPDGRKERLTPRARQVGRSSGSSGDPEGRPTGDRQDGWLVSCDGVGQQGVYEFVEVSPEVLPRRRFAVNERPLESDLSRLTRDDFGGAFAGGAASWRSGAILWRSGAIQWIGQETPVEDFVAKLHSVTELTPGVLWALVAVLGMESFLAVRFGRRRGATASLRNTGVSPVSTTEDGRATPRDGGDAA